MQITMWIFLQEKLDNKDEHFDEHRLESVPDDEKDLLHSMLDSWICCVCCVRKKWIKIRLTVQDMVVYELRLWAVSHIK